MLPEIQNEIYKITENCFKSVPQNLPEISISDVKSASADWDFSTAWAFKAAPLFGLCTETFTSILINAINQSGTIFKKVSSSGNGYINLYVKDSWINEQINILAIKFSGVEANNLTSEKQENNNFLVSYCYAKICRIIRFYNLLNESVADIDGENRNIAIFILQLHDSINRKNERKYLERLAKVFYRYDSQQTWCNLMQNSNIKSRAAIYKACGYVIKSCMDRFGIPQADY